MLESSSDDEPIGRVFVQTLDQICRDSNFTIDGYLGHAEPEYALSPCGYVHENG